MMMLSVIITGVPGVSLRAGSCSTPHKTATSQPRRQSTSAMVIDRTRRAAKMMVIIAGSGCGTPRRGRSFRIRDQPPAAAAQSPRQQQAADFAGELRRNRPRMRQVKPRDDVGAQAAEGVAPERRPMLQREVVVAGRMHRRRGRAVIAEWAKSAAGEFEVTDRRARLEEDLPAGRGDPQREVGLESIRGADEVLVEAA